MGPKKCIFCKFTILFFLLQIFKNFFYLKNYFKLQFMKEMNLIKNEKLTSIFFIEIAEILNEKICYNQNNTKFLVTLIKIHITPDMNLIKVYIRIYPFWNEKILKFIRSKSGLYRKLLSKRLRYRVKKIPKLDFCKFS